MPLPDAGQLHWEDINQGAMLVGKKNIFIIPAATAIVPNARP